MFSGSFVAIVTPFSDDGAAVDFGQLKELIEWQLECGTDGIVPAGSTGEAATMSHHEQMEVIRVTVETVAGRAKVIAGTGSNNTPEALQLTRAAHDVGVDAVLVVTPYYNKPMPDGLVRHYSAIAEIGAPMVLYNVPSRTGSNMLPETVARLVREVDGIVAIKEASGSVMQSCHIHQLCSDLTILSGDDAHLLPLLAVGASGIISVAANVVPAEMKQLATAGLAGDFNRAREIHYQLLPLMDALFVETNPIPVKAALKHLGRINGVMRSPLSAIGAASDEELLAAMQQVGCGEEVKVTE